MSFNKHLLLAALAIFSASSAEATENIYAPVEQAINKITVRANLLKPEEITPDLEKKHAPYKYRPLARVSITNNSSKLYFLDFWLANQVLLENETILESETREKNRPIMGWGYPKDIPIKPNETIHFYTNAQAHHFTPTPYRLYISLNPEEPIYKGSWYNDFEYIEKIENAIHFDIGIGGLKNFFR